MDLISAKVLSMLSLGIGSFLIGILPLWLSPFTRRRCPILLSCLLCFGGGVLLATSILHMLPEARETFPDYAEIALCGGFFFIYFVDEMVHFICGDKLDNNEVILTNNSNRDRRMYEDLDRPHRHQHSHNIMQSYRVLESEALLQTSRVTTCDGNHSREPDPCHINHEEPCMRSKAGFLGLMVALLLHSVLEGLAIGLESAINKVLLLLMAVSSHKFVVGFCLGTELSSSGGRTCTHVVAILIFSLGSVLGIGGGMIFELSALKIASSWVGALQALAAGTLLYVTVSEVLPRERAKWHHGVHFMGLLQLFSTICGFALLYLLNRYCGE